LFRRNLCANCFHTIDLHENVVIDQNEILEKLNLKCTMSNIDTNLYLGSVEISLNETFLKKNGITHVLNCAKSLEKLFPSLKTYSDKFNYMALPMIDSKMDITPYIKEGVAFIDDAIKSGGKIYVHCARGVSRSVSIIIAYLMYHYSISFDDALVLIKSKHPQSDPNPYFVEQLKKLKYK
jgi:predicted protein tyrosine phosphatase